MAVSLLGVDERKLLAGYIHSICGIQLDESKQYLIESRLGALLEETRSGTFSELYNKARSDATGSLERSIINAITTRETSFFRDGSPFELLRHKIIPDLIDRRSRSGSRKIPIRIWSAACSAGQEVYTIAMVLRELLGGAEKYDIRLLGTDISPDAIARASRGIYNKVEMGRGIEASLVARHFVNHPDGWKVRDEIRAMASFRNVNLLRDFSSLGQFDIIFCRNVAIYFSPSDKADLFGRVERSLAPDGYLIIGSTESLTGVNVHLEPRRYLRSLFYQR